jgi:hypothetical protein
LSREPYDDCPCNVAVSSVSLQICEGLVLARTFECEPRQLFEPFGPEIGGHPVRPEPDLACVAGVDRKRNEAQASEADPDVVDVEIELAGDLVGDELRDRWHAPHRSRTAATEVCPIRRFFGGRIDRHH